MQNGNHLAESKSPYLLQHATNPVDWYPWGSEALARAKEEDKPILVSIGYSSCHWCHVMAHESFEDDSVAALMNSSFINIKIDREERPDIDQVYMDAVQAMGLRGGWPLNVFLTPDQKPFYGGTYFPKEGWIRLLHSIKDAYNNKRDQLEESAEQFTQALNANASSRYYMSSESVMTIENLRDGFLRLSQTFDATWGGINKSPKFPVPSTWAALASWYYVSQDEALKNHFLFTLDKMADGGIYDQVGGGFARYSTDREWHVPHFEKMLYDNGQLLSLYAQGFRISKNNRYLEVMKETATWLEREMLDMTGGFYSALDADSEGVEGKFYVWPDEEFRALAGNDYPVLANYYDVSPDGNWEGKNVLRILIPRIETAFNFGLEPAQLDEKISHFKASALQKRVKRIRPGLDNKIIAGWNALVLFGLLDAYQATGEVQFKELAMQNYQFLTTEMIRKKTLFHVYDQPIEGFADDYAATIQALVKYYETVFDTKALVFAANLMETMNTEFWDPDEKMYFYTGIKAENLIARQKEMMDNVIPASNSIMAENLLKLGLHLDNEEYKSRSYDMVNQVSELVGRELEYMANWAQVALLMLKPLPEIAIIGDNAIEIASAFNALHLPIKVISASKNESDLPLLQYKSVVEGETTIFVCFNKACKLPVHTIEDALNQIPK